MSLLQTASWELAADIATVVGVSAAIVGAAAAWWQIHTARVVQQEINAKQIYAQFLRLAFEHPQFAEPGAKVWHTDPEHGPKYIWFVSNMMNAMDEILLMTPYPEWRVLVRNLVSYHAAYIATDSFRQVEYPTYSLQLRKLVDEVVAQHSQGSDAQPDDAT